MSIVLAAAAVVVSCRRGAVADSSPAACTAPGLHRARLVRAGSIDQTLVGVQGGRLVVLATYVVVDDTLPYAAWVSVYRGVARDTADLVIASQADSAGYWRSPVLEPGAYWLRIRGIALLTQHPNASVRSGYVDTLYAGMRRDCVVLR